MKIVKTIVALLMTALLSFTLVYCNFFNDDDGYSDSTDTTNNGGDGDNASDNIPLGSEIGYKCPSYALELVDGNGETVSIKDFAGKAVVVNFWGTWCGPCKAELPHFNQLASEYADDVVFLIIHSSFDSADAPTYIANNFPGSKMVFAYDQPLTTYIDKYFSLLGGSDYYPRTLVLDGNGIITFTFDGGLSYDKLKAEIDEALAK